MQRIDEQHLKARAYICAVARVDNAADVFQASAISTVLQVVVFVKLTELVEVLDAMQGRKYLGDHATPKAVTVNAGAEAGSISVLNIGLQIIPELQYVSVNSMSS